jgi:hypothetical protein
MLARCKKTGSAGTGVVVPARPAEEPAEITYTMDTNEDRDSEKEQRRNPESDKPEDDACCQFLCSPFKVWNNISPGAPSTPLRMVRQRSGSTAY